MFSDKQKQSWQNVKAPSGLFEKIETAVDTQTARPRTFKRIAFPLIAASLLFVFAAVFIMGRTSSVDVYLNDVLLTQNAQVLDLSHEPMTLSRSAVPTSSVKLTVDSDSETVIKTENGEFSVLTESGDVIFSGNEYTLKEKSILIWTYPLKDGISQLMLECGMHTSIVEVEYDAINIQQTVKCLKN